jgi:hydrogenase-1 operon protein HyaE
MPSSNRNPVNQPATSLLIQRLSEVLGYPLVDLNNIDTVLGSAEHVVLFFTEDSRRFPEANDVAVVLPELIGVFPELKPAVVARCDEKALQKQYGFTSWPALVFLRHGQYLGALTGIQDWSVYLGEIRRILDAELSRPPTVGIPVVVQ